MRDLFHGSLLFRKITYHKVDFVGCGGGAGAVSLHAADGFFNATCRKNTRPGALFAIPVHVFRATTSTRALAARPNSCRRFHNEILLTTKHFTDGLNRRNMFNFTPLLGARSASPASQSLLEFDGGIKILVDVGWDESFDIEKLKDIEKCVLVEFYCPY